MHAKPRSREDWEPRQDEKPCTTRRPSQFGNVPKPFPLLSDLWVELAALALAGAGFWLVPEDPALPALLLVALAVPLMLLSWLVLWIAERPARRRRRDLVRRGTVT